MAELKILVLFLISVNYKELLVQCEDVYTDDYAYDSMERSSTEMSSDNELTHVRTKNLSGNVILTTLELLTTTTPFDKLNNDGIFDRTTDGVSSENKQDGTIAENQTISLDSLSEDITKAPTDGTVDLMDVSNGTSGALPDRAATEKQITSEELIDERTGVFTENVDTNSPFVYAVEEVDAYTTDFYRDFTTSSSAVTTISGEERETEKNEVKMINLSPELETRKSEHSVENIEDLSSFMNVDEELLNAVTDDVNKETGEDISVAVEDVSSILKPIEDNFEITKYKNIISTTEDISAFTIMKEDMNEDIYSMTYEGKEEIMNEISETVDELTTASEAVVNGETSTENFLVTTINEDHLKEEATKVTEENTQYNKTFEEIMNENRKTDFSNEYDYNSIYDLEQPEENLLLTSTTVDENPKEKIKIQNEEGIKENELNGILKEDDKEQATDYESISMPTTDSFIDIRTEDNDVIFQDNNLNYISSISTEPNEKIMTTSGPVTHSYFLEETDEFVGTTSKKDRTEEIKTEENESGITTTEEIFIVTIPVPTDQEQTSVTDVITEESFSTVTAKEIVDFTTFDEDEINAMTENEESKISTVTAKEIFDKDKTPTTTENEEVKYTFTTHEITEESKISTVTTREIIHSATIDEDETLTPTENEEINYTFTSPMPTDQEQASIIDEIAEESQISTVISKESIDSTTIDKDERLTATENEEINYTFTSPMPIDQKQASVIEEISKESKINPIISKESIDSTTIDEDERLTTTENEEINYTETVDSGKHNFNLTKAEMLTTEEMHNEMEPQISVNISGKITQTTIKIYSNESSFFVPPDAVSTFRPPNTVNITWCSSQIGINNSLELNIGKSIQLNIVKGNQMHVYKAALHSSENKLENVDTNVITLDGGIRIHFSDADFLKTDRITKGKLEPETGSTAQESKTLVGEIIGGCLGVLVVTVGAISLLVMRAKRKTRNFKPNQV